MRIVINSINISKTQITPKRIFLKIELIRLNFEHEFL